MWKITRLDKFNVPPPLLKKRLLSKAKVRNAVRVGKAAKLSALSIFQTWLKILLFALRQPAVPFRFPVQHPRRCL